MTAHVLDELHALLDGELAPARRREVEGHVDACQSCRAELSQLREVSAMVRSLPERPLPQGFMQKLQRRRAAPAPSRAPQYLLPAPARYAAFAMSSVIVSVFLYEQARVAFPIIGAGSPAGAVASRLPSAALSAEDMEQGKASRARAAGDPLFAGAAAPGTMASELEAKKGPSNMELLARLEKQKAEAGIQGYIAPSPEMEALRQLRAGVNARLLKAVPTPAHVAENGAAALLSQPEDKPARVEKGAPLVADEAPAAAPAASAETLVLRSAEEREKAWADRGLRAAPPTVSFEANVIALVVAPDLESAVEIVGVDTRAAGLTVRYRLFPRMAAVALGGKSVAPTRAYQYRVVPRGDKPVLFERAE